MAHFVLLVKNYSNNMCSSIALTANVDLGNLTETVPQVPQTSPCRPTGSDQVRAMAAPVGPVVHRWCDMTRLTEDKTVKSTSGGVHDIDTKLYVRHDISKR